MGIAELCRSYGDGSQGHGLARRVVYPLGYLAGFFHKCGGLLDVAHPCSVLGGYT